MRILFVSESCYLEDSNGAAIASRALLKSLSEHSHRVAVVCGSMPSSKSSIDDNADNSLLGFLGRLDPTLNLTVNENVNHGYINVVVNSISVYLPYVRDEVHSTHNLRSTTVILPVFEELVESFRPDIIVGYGSGQDQQLVFAFAQTKFIPIIFIIHNFQYNNLHALRFADGVITPSLFAAHYYRESLGLACQKIYNVIDFERSRCTSVQRKYVTFVNPTLRKGVWVFARIADDLGRLRPDIPFLVVESTGTELDVAACGIDLRKHNNIFFLKHTSDPRKFWRLTRICLLPSLWWENQPLTAIEAMANGIPVIGSDRGGIPETLGHAGIAMPLPERLTGITSTLPSSAEVRSWVESIINLWDDEKAYERACKAALKESARWDSNTTTLDYENYFLKIMHNYQTNKSISCGSRSLPVSKQYMVIILGSSNGFAEIDHFLKEVVSSGIKIEMIPETKDFYHHLNVVISRAILENADAILLLSPYIASSIPDLRRVFARPELIITSFDPQGASFASTILELLPTSSLFFGFLRIRIEVFSVMIARFNMVLHIDSSNNLSWDFFSADWLRSQDDSIIYQNPEEAFRSKISGLGFCPMLDPSLFLRSFGRSSPWAKTGTTWDQLPGMFDFPAVYDSVISELNGPSVIVEVGNFLGRSICYLATKARDFSLEYKIYAVDTCRGSQSDSTGQVIAPSLGVSFAGTLHENIINCRLDDIIVPIITSSCQASKLFSDQSLDFCFIDGDHSYKSVFGDISFCWPKIKPGGVLAGHDYKQTAPWLIDVTKAVHDFFDVADASHPLCDTCWMIRKMID